MVGRSYREFGSQPTVQSVTNCPLETLVSEERRKLKIAEVINGWLGPDNQMGRLTFHACHGQVSSDFRHEAGSLHANLFRVLHGPTISGSLVMAASKST